MVVELPVQRGPDVPAPAAGSGFTVILTECEATHPFPLVSVKVYVIVLAGVTVGFEAVDELSPVVGLHK